MLDETRGYAVFLFPQALEALGEAIKPYLLEGSAGPHILCREIDTAGALIEMTLDGQAPDGKAFSLELMVPTSMVRMIVSARSGGSFGFGPRAAMPAASLPPVGPTGAPPEAPPESVPPSVDAPTQTPPKP